MTEVELIDDAQRKESYLFKDEVKGLLKQWEDGFIYSHLNMPFDEPVNITLKISRNKYLKNADYTFMYDWFGDSFRVLQNDEVLVKCSPFAMVNWAL